MAELTDQELLLLNNIMYLESSVISEAQEDLTISDILKRVNIEELSKLGDTNYKGTHTTGAEWVGIVEKMQQNEAISSLKLADIHSDGTGGLMACFVDQDNHATVVYRGTGSVEWKDNFTGGYTVSTRQQDNALDYINSLPYDDITVTGHSKGGNKAKYVALLSDKVDRCISYDGQGFSQEFLDEYAPQIAANRDKITSYAVDNDYVNILLFDIYGEKHYLEGVGIGSFEENHCPNSANFYVDQNGDLQVKAGTQSEAMEEVQSFFNYVLNTSSDSDKEKLLGMLGDTAQMLLGDGKNVNEAMEYLLQTENAETLGTLLAYIYRYEKESDGLTAAIREVLSGMENTETAATIVDVVDWLLEQGWSEAAIKNLLKNDWLMSKALDKFTDFNKEQKDTILSAISTMYEKQDDLPYSDFLTRSPADVRKPSLLRKLMDRYRYTYFAADLNAMGSCAQAFLTMSQRADSISSEINSIQRGLNHFLDQGIVFSLGHARSSLSNTSQSLRKMGNTLDDITGMYQRNEKRILSQVPRKKLTGFDDII